MDGYKPPTPRNKAKDVEQAAAESRQVQEKLQKQKNTDNIEKNNGSLKSTQENKTTTNETNNRAAGMVERQGEPLPQTHRTVNPYGVLDRRTLSIDSDIGGEVVGCTLNRRTLGSIPQPPCSKLETNNTCMYNIKQLLKHRNKKPIEQHKTPILIEKKSTLIKFAREQIATNPKYKNTYQLLLLNMSTNHGAKSRYKEFRNISTATRKTINKKEQRRKWTDRENPCREAKPRTRGTRRVRVLSHPLIEAPGGELSKEPFLSIDIGGPVGSNLGSPAQNNPHTLYTNNDTYTPTPYIDITTTPNKAQKHDRVPDLIFNQETDTTFVWGWYLQVFVE